jgi:Putative transposase
MANTHVAIDTHRVAISNRPLIAADARAVTFKVKDYRIDGPGRDKTMTLAAHEFIRRFLIHVLPKGFHRIRHYGLLASGVKANNLALTRKLLDASPPAHEPEDAASDPVTPHKPCPCCGSAMRLIEVFKAGDLPRHRPTAIPAIIRIDTS